MMMPSMQGFALIAVFVAVFVGVAWWLSSKRRKEIQAWAEAKGLRFQPTRDRSLDERYSEFTCLRRGHSRYAYNGVAGNWNGRDLLAFDYHYATGAGKNRHDYRFSAIILSSTFPLRPLTIRTETVFDKLTDALGFEDIDFESSEFSREFHVGSPDRRWAFDVVHQRTMEFLLGQPRFALQFGRREVIVWRNRKLSTQMFDAAIKIAEGILVRVPDYVIQSQGGEG